MAPIGALAEKQDMCQSAVYYNILLKIAHLFLYKIKIWLKKPGNHTG